MPIIYSDGNYSFTIDTVNCRQSNYPETIVQYMNKKQLEKELNNITETKEVDGVWQVN